MAVVNIKIGKRDFKLSCGDGQEEHLRRLANQFSKRVDKISAGLNNAGDSLMLVMAALTLQEELNSSTKSTPNVSVENSRIAELQEKVSNIKSRIDKLL